MSGGDGDGDGSGGSDDGRGGGGVAGAPVRLRRFTVMVCRGPTCGEARGSAALTARLHEMVSLRGLEAQVSVLEETCFGHCLRGPNVLVYDTDEASGRRVYGPESLTASAVLYNRMTISDLEKVVERHLVGGMVVRPFLNRPPARDP
ncbi:MAG TPA: (2Fe-2S) ferredoxin domain-containing protein [Polyangia bacterium]|jgi:(2Fe-2S) ferredoxin|nr:(2Fe-2S) ferredoxin domain-containing protein [Polyangia bacterium]